MKYSILVVDDEAAQRQLLGAVLGRDYLVEAAAAAEEAMRLLEKRSFDLIITDERMPGMSGLDLVKWVRGQSIDVPVIVLTAYGSIETAVEAIKIGAQDYLTKPLKSPDELRLVVGKVLKERSLSDQSLIHRDETEMRFPADIIAESRSMREVMTLASQVAPQTTSVLLTGESGTGKEVIARFIHRRSMRVEGPFVAVNCAALTETLLESELFGHERGAFTGATQTRRGRFELAQAGTLFLDEIGEMSGSVQAKLLRVLQEREFERVGGTRTITVDVRVIAATNRDLRSAIEQGSFREDLYYRLSVFPIHIPPLRERREDIMPLADFFLKRISARMGRAVKPLGPEVRHLLYHYDWPGNVRELENALERALIVSREAVIVPSDMPLRETEAPARPPTLAEMERDTILDTLRLNDGDRRKTADQLGISLRTLQYRLKEYGVAGRE